MRLLKTQLCSLSQPPFWHGCQGRRRMLDQVGDCLFFDNEIGRVVLNVSDFRINDRHAAAGIIAHPQTVPGVRSDSVIGNVNVFQVDIGKRALTVLAAWSNYAQPIRQAVPDIYIADVYTGNAAAIHAQLKRSPPCPIMVISATPDQIAVSDHGRPAEVVVNFSTFIGSRKSRTDQY